MKVSIAANFQLTLALAGVFITQSLPAADPSYHLLKEIPLPTGGKCVTIAIDETSRQLCVAHGNQVNILNLDNSTLLGTIKNPADVSGFAAAPRFHFGFTACTGNKTVVATHLTTLRPVTRLNAAIGAGPLIFEPGRAEIYAFSQTEGSVTIAEADDGDFEGTIKLGGCPVSAATDSSATIRSKGMKVFCGLADKDEIAVIDAGTHKLTNRWPVAPGKSPRALAFDSPHARLFAACTNKLLVLLDAATGKTVATAPIAEGATDVVYDPGLQNAFCLSGDGRLTVIHEESADKLTVSQTVQTESGAAVLSVDSKTHRLFIGVSSPTANTKLLVFGP